MWRDEFAFYTVHLSHYLLEDSHQNICFLLWFKKKFKLYFIPRVQVPVRYEVNRRHRSHQCPPVPQGPWLWHICVEGLTDLFFNVCSYLFVEFDFQVLHLSVEGLKAYRLSFWPFWWAKCIVSFRYRSCLSLSVWFLIHLSKLSVQKRFLCRCDPWGSLVKSSTCSKRVSSLFTSDSRLVESSVALRS